jgi:outer membrane protein
MNTTALLLALVARTITLAEAEQAAETQKPEVRVAHANTAAGAARTEQARAPLLPQVKIEAEYLRTTGNRVQKPGRVREVTNSTTTYNWFDGEVSASQLIWDFGKSYDRWKAADSVAVALGNTERAARLQALYEVRAAYFRARAQRALSEVARQTLANQERHYTQAAGFVSAGTRPEIDLAQARADRANARVQLIKATDGYAIARAELLRAMGTTGDLEFDLADDGFPPQPGELTAIGALVDEAIHARPELAALDAQLRGQELARQSARGDYFPSLNLVAGANDAGVQFRQTHILDNFGQVQPYGGMAWNVYGGVRLTWHVFEGLVTRGQIKEADAALESLRAQRDQQVQQVWLAVQQAAMTVRAALEAVTAADDALAGARERQRLADGRYMAGAGSIIELGDAELSAANAAAQRVGAEYALATARAALALALGRR